MLKIVLKKFVKNGSKKNCVTNPDILKFAIFVLFFSDFHITKPIFPLIFYISNPFFTILTQISRKKKIFVKNQNFPQKSKIMF